MKNLTAFAAILLISNYAEAQKFYFPVANYRDSSSLAAAIPGLAKSVIRDYHETDTAKYLDNLFRYQVVAHDYAQVNTTLDRLAPKLFADTTKRASLGAAYRLFSLAMLHNSGGSFDKNNDGFITAYKTTFYPYYERLDDNGQAAVGSYLSTEAGPLKLMLDEKTKQLATADSLTLSQAMALCRLYCSYIVYSNSVPLAKPILVKIDNDRFIVDDSVLIKLPNGANIAMTIARGRKATQPLPVVLLYNIYPGQDLEDCKEAVRKGFIGIVANTRGKRLSPDMLEPFEHDADDAYYIIDWISKQSWCNGKVGMYGGSYLGFSQWSAVKRMHPALKTIVPEVSVGAGIDYPMMNGVFMSFMLRWLHFVSDNKMLNFDGFLDTPKWDSLYTKWYRSGTAFGSLDSMDGRPNILFQRWLKHPTYDSYWQKMTPQKEEFAKINIPIFTTTGYYDDDQTGAMYYYEQYHRYNKSPNYYLLIGPYDHGGSQGFPKQELTNYKIDKSGVIPIHDIIFEWFNYILKDSVRPAILSDKVNFEVMGANQWRHVGSLDEMHSSISTFYLGGKKNSDHYSLLQAKPAAEGFIAQTVNLADRSRLHFVSEELSFFKKIINDSADGQQDQIKFVSAPLTAAAAISGKMTADLVLSVNKKDVDIVIDLYELTPEGTYFALAETVKRASFNAADPTRRLLQPNVKTTVRIDQNYITCRQLQPGSRIVVLVGVNKNHNWEINYGTGKDVSRENISDAKVPMHVRWYNSSAVHIPMLQ